MADIQITGLPELTSIQNTDLVHVKRGTTDFKMTYENFLNSHLSDLNNPHAVSKSQLGLSNVTNDAQLKINSNLSDLADIPAARTNLGVFSQAQVTAQVDLHGNLTNNPHGVTRTQVGLGDVLNARQLVAANNLSDLISVSTARINLDVYSRTETDTLLASHVNRRDNPHVVTRTQVGLGNVSNFTVATNFNDGSTTKYANAAIVLEAHNAAVSTSAASLLSHTSNTSNPHGTTKSHVGLSNVQNFSVTNDYAGSSTTLYVSQRALSDGLASISTGFTQTLTSHIANVNNPHGTTKAHVGLSNVQNFPVSSSATSTSANSYANSAAANNARILAINSSASSLSAHTAQSNPHGTSRSDVGLGSVQNYPASNSFTLNSPTTYSTSQALFNGLADVRSFVSTGFLPSTSWVQFGGNLNSADGGAISGLSILKGKEVFVVAIDNDGVDEIFTCQCYIPLQPTGLGPNLEFVQPIRSSNTLRYRYNQNQLITDGYSIKRIYYREPQDLPNLGTIAFSGNG